MDINTQNDRDPYINQAGSYQNFSTNGNVDPYARVDGMGPRDSWKMMAENLYHDMSGLWESQSMLIRTEMNEKLTEIKAASVSLGAGSVLMIAGAFSLVATAIISLNLFLPLWASAIIVTVLLFVVGGVLIAGAKKKLEVDKIKPTRSIDTFGEISTTLKERLYEFKKH